MNAAQGGVVDDTLRTGTSGASRLKQLIATLASPPLCATSRRQESCGRVSRRTRRHDHELGPVGELAVAFEVKIGVGLEACGMKAIRVIGTEQVVQENGGRPRTYESDTESIWFMQALD